MLFDLHVHTTYSDGKWNIKEAVNKLKTLGASIIAITDHFYSIKTFKPPKGYRFLDLKRLDEYVHECLSHNAIPGLELEYSDQLNSTAVEKEHVKNIPVRIGSIHFIMGVDIFSDAVLNLNHSKLIDMYIEHTINLIQDPKVNIIGHILSPPNKLIKPLNNALTESLMKEIALKIEHHNKIVEINGKHPSPIKLLKLLSERNISFSIASDSHSPEEANRILQVKSIINHLKIESKIVDPNVFTSTF